MVKHHGIALGILEMLVGLGAIPSGLAMIVDPTGQAMGLPLSLLEGSPFGNFFIPGLFLFVGNGLYHIFAAIVAFRNHPSAGYHGLAAGIFLTFWMIIQIAFLGLTHWLQAVYLLVGLMEVGMSLYWLSRSKTYS